MKEIKEKEKTADQIVASENKAKGLTIEQIRFKRAMVAMEAEFCKMRMMKSVSNIQASNPFIPGNKTTFTGKAGAIALKMVNGLNYLDYILLAFSIFKGSKKILSFFRGRHK